MNDKYKISLLSIAMAVIVLGSMVAVTGVSAAQTPVGSTSTANVAAASDGTTTVLAAQGLPGIHSVNNIYYATTTTPAAGTQTWIAIGVGTNPCVVYTGTTGHFAIFWNNNGALTGVTIVGTTVTAVPASTLPTTSVAAGTGPTAVYTAGTPAQTDILYVATGGALMDWSMNTATGNWGTTLGGNVLVTPAASTTSTGAGITVVVKGTNAIYEMNYALGGWGGYSKFHDGAIGLGASLIRTTSSNMFLFVAGTQGRMWVLYSANDGSTWSTLPAPSGTHNLYWNSLGGVLKSAPATAYGGTTPAITAYVVGGDYGIWSNAIVSSTMPIVTGTWSSSSIVGP